MAEPCKLSAMTLALRALVNNEELTRRLADIAEEGNSAALFGDALREWVVESVRDANEYTLKKESADIKFKAVLFWWVLANTRQWDEALDLLAQEIKNTHWTVAEWLNLVELISEMDLSWLEEAARVVFNTTTEEASKIVEEMRVKISNYIGSEYSVVTSGSSIKADKVIKSLDKEIDDAVAKLDKAKELLWEKTYNDVDKDLKRLKSQPKNNSKYWSTKEWRAETNKLADKYWKPHNKRILENYLEDISEAKKIVSEQSDRLEILSKTYQDALNKDLKLIEAGQNPMEYIGADAEWKFIKWFDNSVSQRAKQYWQYALARTLLTDWWDIPQSVYDVLVKTVKWATGSWIVNYLDEPLTEDWLLNEDRTLEELLTRAYTNTKQLVSDWNLRTIYRQQLIALASDGELTKQNVEYIESLLNTMRLSEVWAGFSDVLKYNSLLQNAEDLWLDVSKYSWATLRRDITDFLEEDAFDTLLKRWNTITLKRGLQMTHRELLELVSNMAWSLELKKAIAINQWTDNDLLRVAAKYLIWDVTDWVKRLKDLIWVAKENPVTDDIRWVILKAITGKNVPEKTKVAFFDFRKELTAAEDVKFRAEYLDKLSDANKIEIPNATIPEVTTTSVDWLIRELSKDEWKWGYLMVNDSQRKLNEVLEQALYNVNYWRKAEDRIQRLYPKGWLMWQFRSEWGKLIFRTPYSSMFDEFLQTVALRTFWQAGGDSKFTKDLIDKLTKWDLDAISEVNKTLEEDARKYYWEMLWRDAYDEKLIPMLEEATWISFKNYNSIVDKIAFWKRVDDRFMLEWKVLWKYTQDVVTVSDVLKDIDALTPESIAAELTQRFWYEIPVSQITENWVIKPDIKTAYTNYKLSQTPLELLERKWKLLAVINWWTADNITTNQFRSMIQSEDFSAYKEIFFHNTELSDEDLHKVYKQINDMIFDNLWAQVADNLVDMWYRLPLVNIRDLIYDWAKWTLDANNWFARAFLAKNDLDPTLSTLNSIIDEAIPNELKFSYDEWVRIADDIINVEDKTTVPDYIYRLSEVTNEFMQDTYSSLVAMSAIRAWAKLPNAWHERQILQEMLNKYYQAFEDATAKWKTLSFKEAQDLKTRMGYALDMFEQNYLAPQYQRFLTPDEKNELFWLKYALWVTTNSDWLNTIREYNSKIMNRYTSATNRVLDRAELITSSLSKTTKSVNEEIEERQQELINQWATMKVVDWQPVVVDMRSELSKQLQNIPWNIIWLEQLKILWRSWLERLSNEEVFFLLNVVELAKNAENKMNLITKTIYKVSPQLAKVDFFNTFKAVDWLPKALHGNLLNGWEALAKYTNTDGFDKEVKKDIFWKIKNKFRENWQLSYDELSNIIKDSIDTNIKLLANTVKWSDLKVFKKEASMIYQGAFNLYTLLKDVPKWVKESIDEILNEQKEWIISALNMLWDNNKLPEIMDAISIVTSDGTVKTFRQILDWEEANLSKTLFDEETNVIKAADEAAQETIDRSWKESKQKKVEAENRITVEKVNNNYRDWLQAYLNKMEVASQAERDLINTTWTAAREIAKQYTLTNKLADTDNALASINEAIMRDFKSWVLGFLWNITQWWQLVKWLWNIWDNIIKDVMDKWKLVQDRYRTLYSMSTEQLSKFEPKNIIDWLALNLALYFKEIESRLGSIDWLTWWTTSRDINRAFAHLWEVVLNIDSVHALFSLMSWVEWNQILKFFRFANPWDAARVDEFIIGWLWQQYLWGYRNFVDTTDQWFNRERFNKTFASNLSEMEYRKLIQALCWFTITSPKFRWLEQIFNFVNQSDYLFRVLMSYPWQLVTIHPQTIAYWLKQTWWEKELQAEDLWAIDAVRRQTWILNTTYNEINWFRYASPDSKDPTAFFNRYGLPDVDDLMEKEKFYTSDDISSIYSKIDNYWSQGWIEARFNKFLRNTDAYKDNANNIIDWFFARNFKNIAFLKALQSNNYMKFATAEQFARFMASDAPEAMKKKLMEAVAESSGRNFRNILWLGFSWLDRAVWWSWQRNIWIWLMQMFNFRWAWWQNIARQTWNWLSTSLYMAKNWLSKEWRDAMALYIAKQPEWTNFVTQLFNDLKYSRELVKFQDNGDWDPTDDDLSIIDFIQYAYETMQFSSQWRQGIQSYWTTRILWETIWSAIQTAVDPEIYKDTLWIWAFMNALSKNLWRNWKVPNLMVKTLWQNGRDEKWAYLWNEFWKLSFWTLRYLMNEDETSYWYSTELVRWRPWAIPFVISWETSEDWDKAFSYDLANTETWLNIVNWWEADDPEMARAYMMNNLDSFFNASQLFWIVKNIGRGVASSSLIWDKMKWWLSDDLHIYKFWSPFDLAEIWDIVYDTEAWHDFIKYWQYRPTDARDVKILIDEVIWQANHRPGNDWFNKSMFDFDKSDHMASLESSNSADAFMELLLSNIKYERDDNFNFIVDEKWKKIETNYWKTHMADMMRHMNDNDYMTNSNYEFINTWVEANNDDPNYMLYRRLISEWLAWRYTTQQINSLIDQHNKVHWYKGSEKLNLTKLKIGWIYDIVYPNLLWQETLITWEKTDFLTAIMQLDKAATQSANIKMIERQLAERWDNETIQKLFNINKKWEISLWTKYESYLKEQAKLSQALNEWDVDKFIAETSWITRMFRDEDPYWLMTTTLIASRISRINNADTLSVEQKAKAIDALFTDNYDFIQTHIPQLIEAIWDKDLASDYVAQMNNSLYDISYIWDKLIADSEMSNSKRGRSSAVNISTKAKDLLWSLWKSTWSWDWVWWWKNYDYNVTPVKLDWAKLLKMTWAKWYTPQSSSEAIQAYKAHSNFGLSKDINRKVKTTKTQTVSSKKQLSNIESKTTKALEAES